MPPNSSIIVSPLVGVEYCLYEYTPDAVISLVDNASLLPRITNTQHLKYILADDDEAGQHIALTQIFAFIGQYHWQKPLLVHCVAGISRSPAVALAILSLWYRTQSLECMHALYKIAPHAMPNRSILQQTDTLLGSTLYTARQQFSRTQASVVSNGLPFVLSCRNLLTSLD